MAMNVEPVDPERRVWSEFMLTLAKLEISKVDYYDVMMYYYFEKTWGWCDDRD